MKVLAHKLLKQFDFLNNLPQQKQCVNIIIEDYYNNCHDLKGEVDKFGKEYDYFEI